MTDNEKRAHGLALIGVNVLIQSKMQGEKMVVHGIDGNSDEVNLYESYKSIYDNMLVDFNRDFPVEK